MHDSNRSIAFIESCIDRVFREGLEIQKLEQDATVTSSSGLLGELCFALGVLAQGRVKRRKELKSLRQRIASDLQDDIGSNLSSIALLAELVVEEFTEIKQTADKTIESMRDIVWLIRPGGETWKQMMTRFLETASKLLRPLDLCLHPRRTSRLGPSFLYRKELANFERENKFPTPRNRAIPFGELASYSPIKHPQAGSVDSTVPVAASVNE